MKNFTNYGKKITVLRECEDNNILSYIVVKGFSIKKGLGENFKRFSNFNEALEYFNLIKE